MSYNQRKFMQDLASAFNAFVGNEREGAIRSVFSTLIYYGRATGLQGFLKDKIVNTYEIDVSYQGYSIARWYSWLNTEKDMQYEFLLLTSNGYQDAISTRMRIRDVLDVLVSNPPYLLYKKGGVAFQYAGSKHKLLWDDTSDGVPYCPMITKNGEHIKQLVVYSNQHWSKFIGLGFWSPELINKIENLFN